jgi:hypothetical protein
MLGGRSTSDLFNVFDHTTFVTGLQANGHNDNGAAKDTGKVAGEDIRR